MQTTRFTASGTDGAAVFRQLAPGTYDAKVEYASFSAFLAEAQVQSGITTTVDVILQIRPSGQRISVPIPARPVNVVNPQLQTALQSNQISGLPIGTVRGPLSLGVTAELPRGNTQNPGSFTANGNRGRANNITLDNATATDVITGGVMGLQTVPIDAGREFNLITTNPGAEFGRNSGSQVHILTKSGSNQFHGSLFEFFRNSATTGQCPPSTYRSGCLSPIPSNRHRRSASKTVCFATLLRTGNSTEVSRRNRVCRSPCLPGHAWVWLTRRSPVEWEYSAQCGWHTGDLLRTGYRFRCAKFSSGDANSLVAIQLAKLELAIKAIMFHATRSANRIFILSSNRYLWMRQQ